MRMVSAARFGGNIVGGYLTPSSLSTVIKMIAIHPWFEIPRYHHVCTADVTPLSREG